MRIFFLAVLVLIMPMSALAVTNATLAVDSAPAYNACNGVFVENIAPSGQYSVSEIADNIILTQPYLFDPFGIYSATEIGDGVSLGGPITNAVAPVNSAPAYNACDGAFVEGFSPSSNYSVSEIADGVNLESLAFEPNGVVSITDAANIGEVYWHDVAWQDVNWNHELIRTSVGTLPIIIINMQ